MAWAAALQLGDVASQFLDGIHLLLKELALDEISHLQKKKRVNLEHDVR